MLTLRRGITEAEARYPGTHLEEIQQTLVVEQALAQPLKAPGPSWVADLFRHHQPRRTGRDPAF
ncbi:MAG: hypothetical protein WBB07_00605 [Mycobacterium sp.]